MPKHEFIDLEYQRRRFEDVLQRQPQSVQATLRDALALATTAHAGQEHLPGVPYVIHPLRAALSLVREFGITEPDVVASTLLHDVIEDTSVSRAQLTKLFGARVGQLVQNVSRERPPDEDEEEKIKSKRAKLLWILKQDRATRLVKCADLLDNTRTWAYTTPDMTIFQKLARWFREADELYLRIADTTSVPLAAAMRLALVEAKRVYAKEQQ